MTDPKSWQALYDFLQPKTSPYWVEEPSLKQKLFLRSMDKEVLFGGAAGGGKAVCLETLIPTPDGFKPMKNIHPGDHIFGRDGAAYYVLAESEVHQRPAYRITFDDESTVDAANDHQWLTYDDKELTALTQRSGDRRAAPAGTVRTTQEIADTLTTRDGRTNHAIPVTAPIQLPDKDLPVDPYTLGTWLGDGLTTDSIYDEGLTALLHENDLYSNRHIPHDYLWASENQRLALLQGLMDTNGSISESSVEFADTNRNLVEGVTHLIHSLGMKVSALEEHPQLGGKDDAPKWAAKFSANQIVFRLPRKARSQKIAEHQTTKFRYIKSVETLGTIDVKCIQANAPDHLFLCGTHMIPTHNSSALLMSALQYPLALDTEVPTTDGWKTIGTLSPGDRVFGIDGKPVTVLKKTSVSLAESSKLQFRNGTTVTASNDHLWAMHDFTDRAAMTNSNYKIPPTRPLRGVTTAELAQSVKTTSEHPKHNWSVPVPEPLHFEEAATKLPADPYTIGLWLGGESNSRDTFAVHISDHESIIRVADRTNLVCNRYNDYHVHVSGLIGLINDAGVFHNKHIPEPYLRASLEDRYELLRGLMDAGGTVTSYGSGRLSQTEGESRLVQQAAELARSLGAIANTSTQKYTTPSGESKQRHHVDVYAPFHLFNLQRKKVAQKIFDQQLDRMLWSVESAGVVPVQCITVDNDDHLFLITRDLIPTHNCDVPNYSAILLRRTFADLNLPGALMDRFRDWMSDFDDVKWNNNTFTATFPSGARIAFGYLNNVNDYLRYKGPMVPWTEVLTSSGWKRIDAIEVGELVASMDPATRSWDYEPVTKLWEYDHDGPLYSTRDGSNVSFEVTDNHTWWVSAQQHSNLRKYRTDELPNGAKFPQAATFTGGAKPEITTFPADHTDSKDSDLVFSANQWADFLGWYIAEGSGSSDTINMALHDTSNAASKDSLEATLRAVGATVSRSSKSLRFTNSKLLRWLKDNAGKASHTKRIPDEVFGWDTATARVLLQSLVEGNGAWRTPNEAHCVVASKELADGVMRLAQHCGYRATLDHREDRTTTPDGEEHDVVSFHVHLLYRVNDDTSVSLNIDNPPIVSRPYKGKVHCLTVPPHHTFLTRHNGRVVWTGNSEFQFVGMDEVTEIRQGDYTYLFSRLRRPSIGPLSKVPLRMRATTNPAPNWVRQRFIVEGKAKGRIFIPSTLLDNPGIDHVAYRESLSELDPIERKRLEFGDWWATSLGSTFKREDFIIMGAEDPEFPSFDATTRWVRFWDLAATAPSDTNKDPDWTVGALVAFHDGKYYIMNIQKCRRDSAGVENMIKQVAASDGVSVPIRMEQEPGSSGKNLVDQYSRYVLAGYDFDGVRATGDKETRAIPMSTAVIRGNVVLLRAAWNTDYIDEMSSFPEGKVHDDQVDASVHACNYVAGLGTGFRRKVEIIV